MTNASVNVKSLYVNVGTMVVIIMAVLGFMMAVNSQVSDINTQIAALNSSLEMRELEIRSDQEKADSEIIHRLKKLEEWQERTTANRLTSDQFKLWLERLRSRNTNLNIPDLGGIDR